jgi:hypothetical protein
MKGRLPTTFSAAALLIVVDGVLSEQRDAVDGARDRDDRCGLELDADGPGLLRRRHVGD